MGVGERDGGLRKRIEQAFEGWSSLILDHRLTVVGLAVAVTVGLGSFMSRIEVDSSTESFLKSGDRTRVLYDDYRSRFGRDDHVVIGIGADDVLRADFLGRLRDLHEDLEESVPHLDEVTSLVNARHTVAAEGGLEVKGLLDEWPRAASDFARLRDRIDATPYYHNVVVSRDYTFATIIVEPSAYSSVAVGSALDLIVGGDDAPAYLTDAEEREVVAALHAVVDRHRAGDFDPVVAGRLPMNVSFNEHVEGEAPLLGLAAGVMMIVVLSVLFRRPVAVVLPLVVVVCALVCTFGIVALIGVPLSVVTQILPAFLLTVGICDSVHILTIVYQEIEKGAGRDEAIARAVSHSGLAVVLTSLTTAAGLASFMAAEVAPVATLGIAGPIGVLAAGVFSLTLLPATLAIVPMRRGTTLSLRSGAFVARLGAAAAARAPTTLALGALATAVALAGVWQLRLAHDSLMWFPSDDPIRVAAERVDGALEGISSIEVIVDSGVEGGFHEPQRLRALDEAAGLARGFTRGEVAAANAFSVVEVVKEVNRALADDDDRHYALPTTRAAVAQEMLLFESSAPEELAELTDPTFQTARLSIRVPWVDAILYPDFIAALRGRIEPALAAANLSYHVTGLAEVQSRAYEAVVRSLSRSYAIAFLVIAPILFLLVGSVGRGLLALVPNLIPVVAVLGLMGWLDVPLDAGTLLIGATVFGLAVDDTIHFMHKFDGYFRASGNVRESIQRTLETTGGALFYTTLILATGFCAFLFAYLHTGFRFGLLASFAAVVALLADLLIAPALLQLFVRDTEREAARRTSMVAETG